MLKPDDGQAEYHCRIERVTRDHRAISSLEQTQAVDQSLRSYYTPNPSSANPATFILVFCRTLE